MRSFRGRKRDENGSRSSSDETKIDLDVRSQLAQRLRPEKWKAAFDSEGKLVGLSKVLKCIISGGVDSSIRCEVWEFLLGCYGVGTTRDYREEIRRERRKRYRELIDECRLMHVSIGTGNLAYNVGSKIMDARVTSRQTSTETSSRSGLNERLNLVPAEQSSSTDSVVNQSPVAFSFTSAQSPTYVESDPSFYSDQSGAETDSEAQRFPLKSLLQTESEDSLSKSSPGRIGRIGPNSPNVLHFKFFQQAGNSDIADKSSTRIWTNSAKHENFRKVKALDSAPKKIAIPAGMPSPNPNALQVAGNEERIAEWLWTLHKIVIDVVRTDRHLKFYEDSKNMARMSDILAVYAWVDPETGYCQGMSDLLSPFVVLFENDADAFWCFESLLRRMRHNFQMEGPTGVMNQLEALPKIMELIDMRVYRHLALIGADNFLFAFRMLLLHFRRELPFEEALCMWEMMWAADFDHAMLWAFEHEPLESLRIRAPSRSLQQRIREDDCMDYYCSRISPYASPLPASEDSFAESITYDSKSPLCGLTAGSFWPNFNRQRIRSGLSFGRNGDSEVSVFVVAAILVSNRAKFLKETRSMEDMIKMFNEIQLKIQVRRCVRAALKLRSRYHQQKQQNKLM